MCTEGCELVSRLRKENFDQFLTLVRMHLSFIVEINTDDVDSSTEKQKSFKWGFSKKPRSNSNGPNCANNSSSSHKPENNALTNDGINKVYEMIDFLSQADNVKQIGLFRLTGSVSRQQELKQYLMNGSELHLAEGKFTVHDVASVLKNFLAELPEPLLLEEHYHMFCCLCTQHPPTLDTSHEKFLIALQLLLLLLSPVHRTFLQRLLCLLRLVADNECHNKMSPDALATVFTPHLLCPRKLPPESLRSDVAILAPAISFMIKNFEEVLNVPKQLVTDITAYFAIRERKKMLSPDFDLDESITDRTAANTVFSFVDRSRSNAESAANSTDTALAQLYAHIHSLPDSQHKRRLIKQFNRQNGYGTPIQIARTNKSIGESLKKHIFHKRILNKTPKKSSSQSPTITDKPHQHIKEKQNIDVSHKSIVMKNFQNKITTATFYEESSSDESTLSDTDLVTPKTSKLKTRFVSEPNLSIVECTPKKSKKTRLFRSKNVLARHKKYAPKRKDIKGTPTSCVTCMDENSSASESTGNIELSKQEEPISNVVEDNSLNSDESCSNSEEIRKITTKYITSTPGLVCCDQDMCVTPYLSNLRRSSMSPITKSTQKLSRAMQESIMTPRSRQPLIITADQMEASIMEPKADTSSIYESLSPKNDSDFISSEESNQPSSSKTPDGLAHHDSTSAKSVIISKELKSLTDPFREYLLGRSVLTASPVDLSTHELLNDSQKLSDSLMYCLDGNVPSDVTGSMDQLDMHDSIHLRQVLSNVNANCALRKRISSDVDGKDEIDRKKSGKENDRVWESDL